MSDAVMDRFLGLDAQQGEIPPNKRVLTITEPMAGCQTGSAAQAKKGDKCETWKSFVCVDKAGSLLPAFVAGTGLWLFSAGKRVDGLKFR
jgi:hypothetical protein